MVLEKKTKQVKTGKPFFRGRFHEAMFFMSIGACSLLIFNCDNRIEAISAIIYTFGVLAMFGISALYHRIYWSIQKRVWLKRLDHCAIFLMIAGSGTPVCMIALPEKIGFELLIRIWVVAGLGIFQSLIFVNLPKFVNSIIYVFAGALVLPYLPELSPVLGPANTALLVAGGAVYILGALGYALKRPILNPKIFGYHEFFHVLVTIGALLHFMMIYSLFQNAHSV